MHPAERKFGATIVAALVAALTMFLLVSCGGSSQAAQAAEGGIQTIQTPSGPETVINNIDDLSGWQTCGNCGNTGARGGTAAYTISQDTAEPSEDGSSAQFAIQANAPFENGYWYMKHRLPSAEIKKLTYEFDIYVPSSAVMAPQAIEFECQQRLSGWVYNFAWQANYAGGTWRLFNYLQRQWEDSGIPLTEFAPDQWHHVVAEYHTNASQKKYFHDALTIDGIRHQVNRSHDAKNDGGARDYFANAFQLDSNGHATPYQVYVDEMKVTVQQ